jgi:predicted phage terminase large subunit-like protein
LPGLSHGTGLRRPTLFQQGSTKTASKPSKPRSSTPEDWLKENFPRIATAPLANRHKRLYAWFDSLTAGEAPPTPRIEIWPRGGAKSSTVELAIARLATKKPLTRFFVLYVCATQEQADHHVQAIASLLEELGIDRKLGKYGHSRGWRRNQLRTDDGFNVAAIGLDTAARGIKFDEFRPDLIVFDDIDSEEDTPKTVQKKEQRITKKIIPAGTPNKALLFVQNLIHEDGIVHQLYEGRAKFLHNREVPPPEPAVVGLEVAQVKREDGRTVYKIVAGTPTWEGQNLAACELQINDQGYEEFLRESQHEIHATEGYFFNEKAFGEIELCDLPKGLRFIRAWDFAATHGAGDYTVGVLMAYDKATKITYVVDVIRGQWSSEEVEEIVLRTAESDFDTWGCNEIRFTDDPGQAGKFQTAQLRRKLKAYRVIARPATGSKDVRARAWAKQVNSGNAKLVIAEWNFEYRREHRKFREDLEHEFDDQVDPSADNQNEFEGKRPGGWSAMQEAHEKAQQTNR